MATTIQKNQSSIHGKLMTEDLSRITCINPATGETIGHVPCTVLDDIPRYFQEAREAQKGWAALDFKERRKAMLKVRHYLVNHTEELAKTISESTGKSLSDALLGEVFNAILAVDWYSKKSKKFLKKRRIFPSSILFANKHSYLMREPLGVVGILSPWNYPFAIPFAEIIMALMAGNAVFYKPAEETAMVGQAIEKALEHGGFPKGLCQFMIGDPAGISDSWLQHGIDKLFFTGSVRVGKLLMAKAAETLTPISLELGGNDAMVVLEDANLKRAANGAVWGGFQNSGQACAAVERVYVHESIAEEFTRLVKEKTEALRHGVDDIAGDHDIGSMIVERQIDTVQRHIKDALAKGAKIEAQSQPPKDASPHFFPATVLSQVTHDMQVMQEETFGPVIAITTFSSEEEALQLANDTDLGLTSSVWSMNAKRARQFAEALETGITTINDHVYTHAMAELPWVGWKNSGIGLTHSALGLEEMTKVKVVNYDLVPHLNANLWWFPTSPAKFELFLGILQLLYGDRWSAKWKSLQRLLPHIRKDPLLKTRTSFVIQRLRKQITRLFSK